MAPSRPKTSYKPNKRSRTFAKKGRSQFVESLGLIGDGSAAGHPQKGSRHSPSGISKVKRKGSSKQAKIVFPPVGYMQQPKLKNVHPLSGSDHAEEPESKKGPSHLGLSALSSKDERITKKGPVRDPHPGPKQGDSEVIDLSDDHQGAFVTTKQTDDEDLSFKSSQDDEDEQKSGTKLMDILNRVESESFCPSSSQGLSGNRTQSNQKLSNHRVNATSDSPQNQSLKLKKVNNNRKPQRARRSTKTFTPSTAKTETTSSSLWESFGRGAIDFGKRMVNETKKLAFSDATWRSDSDPTPSLEGKKRGSRRKSTKIVPGATLVGLPDGIPESQPEKVEYNGSEIHRRESSSRRFSSRISAKKKAAPKPETIEIVDTDDEDEDDNTRFTEYDLARVSFGDKILKAECKLEFNSSSRKFAIHLKVPGRTRSRGGQMKKIEFNFLDDSEEVGYFLSNNPGGESSIPLADIDCLLCFLPNGEFERWLKEIFHTPLDRQFCLVCEFRSTDDLQDLVDNLNTIHNPAKHFTKISGETVADVAQVLIRDSFEEQDERRHRSPRHPASSTKYSGKEEEDTLLIYPFECDPVDLAKATDQLNELKIPPDTIEGSSDEASSARGHFLTIRVGDYLRLEPMEYLNDTLIDLWMSWISQNDKSNTHFFSTHFYSALASKGQSVKRWTEKKGLNVFQKKFIFIPVNRSLHWSLAVVVNPGHIGNLEAFERCEKGTDENLEYPAILFFDSLKAHSSVSIASKIRRWLNDEWNRVNGSASNEDVFTAKTFPLHAPKVPYQDNGWDCGVFVCRYAYAMYKLRHETFSIGQFGCPKLTKPSQNAFKDLIAEGNNFVFCGEDIDRIRIEMKLLVERLEILYRKHKRAKKQQKKIGAIGIENDKASEGTIESSKTHSPTNIVSAGSADSRETPQPPKNSEHLGSATECVVGDDGRKTKRKSPDPPSSPSHAKFSSDHHDRMSMDTKKQRTTKEIDLTKDHGHDSCTSLNNALSNMDISAGDEEMSVSDGNNSIHDKFDEESTDSSDTKNEDFADSHANEETENDKQPASDIDEGTVYLGSVAGSKENSSNDLKQPIAEEVSGAQTVGHGGGRRKKVESNSLTTHTCASAVLESEYVPKNEYEGTIGRSEATTNKTGSAPNKSQTTQNPRSPLRETAISLTAAQRASELSQGLKPENSAEVTGNELLSLASQGHEPIKQSTSPHSLSSSRRQIKKKEDELEC